MTLNELKDALENAGRTIISETKLPHGVQLRLNGGAGVNAYETGTFTAHGPNCQRIMKSLREWESYYENVADADSKPERLDRVSVPGIKRILSAAGHIILSEKRIGPDSGTWIKLWGGAVVVVYDSASWTVHGNNPGRVRALLEAAVPVKPYTSAPRRIRRPRPRPSQRIPQWFEGSPWN